MTREYTLKIGKETKKYDCLSDALKEVYNTDADFTLIRKSIWKVLKNEVYIEIYLSTI